jgi:hypothetical protein
MSNGTFKVPEETVVGTTQPKSKSYAAFGIIAAIIGLAYWHPRATKIIPPADVILAQNTALTLRLDQNISSKNSTSGQRFGAQLAQPLMVDGHVVLPAGTEFSGTIAQAIPAGKLSGGATLRIALNSFTFQGKEYRVQAPPIARLTHGQGKRTATVAGGGAVIGAVIGALVHGGKGALVGAAAGAGAGAVGAAGTNHPVDIVMPAESLVTFHLAGPVTVAVAPLAPAHHS